MKGGKILAPLHHFSEEGGPVGGGKGRKRPVRVTEKEKPSHCAFQRERCARGKRPTREKFGSGKKKVK